MAFVRRHYYDLATGDTLLSYMRKGDVITGSVEEDLTKLDRDLSTTGVMEWNTPDPDIERGFSTALRVTVKDGTITFVTALPDLGEFNTVETPEERLSRVEDKFVTMQSAYSRGVQDA